MGIDREQVEEVLADLKQERDDAEAVAERSRDQLVRLASGITPLDELDADLIENTADDFAAAVRRVQLTDKVRGRVRKLLL